MTTPAEADRQYRSDRTNRFFGYGGVDVPVGKAVQRQVDGRYWFLLRKVHLQNYVNITASSVSLSYMARFFDEGRNSYCQNVPMHNAALGGNVHSPNVLPAPMLFGPAEIMKLSLDRVPTRVHWALEGEHITAPDPGSDDDAKFQKWVARLRRRSWYQLGLLDLAATGTQTIDYGDDSHDFAVLRILSIDAVTGVLSNANPGKVKIRQIGPGGGLWSNDEVSNLVYGGAFGWGAGARPLRSPRILTNGTQIEVQTRAIPDTGYNDIVFDGVKFPAGTSLDQWLDTGGL